MLFELNHNYTTTEIATIIGLLLLPLIICVLIYFGANKLEKKFNFSLKKLLLPILITLTLIAFLYGYYLERTVNNI